MIINANLKIDKMANTNPINNAKKHLARKQKQAKKKFNNKNRQTVIAGWKKVCGRYVKVKVMLCHKHTNKTKMEKLIVIV